MRKFYLIVLASLFWSASTFAMGPVQDKALAELKSQFDQIDANRIDQIALGMALDFEASSRFWPLHNEYMQMQVKLRDSRLDLLARYASMHNKNTVTDAAAKKFISESLRHEKQHFHNRQNFMRKISSILTPVQQLRFYQLDLLLDTRLRSGLLAQIPMTQ